MNSLKEIKEKVAHDQKFSTWDEYSAMFPVSSVDELAKECWKQAILLVDGSYDEPFIIEN